MGLLGGLALFLYGMHMMSSGMEAAAGDKMKQILERLTSNRFLGVLVGAGITAIIQSSSATTVMVVGFVNSGMMTLRQAVWVIMGANIGTTITGQLIALDLGALAPVIAFIGVFFVVFIKSKKLGNIGTCITALLASIGTNRNAKRTTIIHFMFNVFGTIIFTLLCYFTPLTSWIMSLVPSNPAAQIAHMHTLFNIVTTLLLLPFGPKLAIIARHLLPDRHPHILKASPLAGKEIL